MARVGAVSYSPQTMEMLINYLPEDRQIQEHRVGQGRLTKTLKTTIIAFVLLITTYTAHYYPAQYGFTFKSTASKD